MKCLRFFALLLAISSINLPVFARSFNECDIDKLRHLYYNAVINAITKQCQDEQWNVKVNLRKTQQYAEKSIKRIGEDQILKDLCSEMFHHCTRQGKQNEIV